MRRIQYEELIQTAMKEKMISLPDVEIVVNDLIQGPDTDEFADETGNFDYENNPRRKLREIAKLFDTDNTECKILGTADDYHNVAVNYAKQNIYDGACKILQYGLRVIPYSIDILADLVRYGISGGQYWLCEEPYNVLSKISKDRWNWRAFSFSIDYLIEKANHVESDIDRNNLKQQALVLADNFIEKNKSDQAYFDKASILREFGDDHINNQTEQSVLQCGLDNVKSAPKCALRLADILFERGEYKDAIVNLWQCCTNTFKPQPDINSSYAFLLLALSKASELFSENQKEDYADSEKMIYALYKDFHTAIRNGLNSAFNRTAHAAIKVIETQTGYEYPYVDSETEDIYD